MQYSFPSLIIEANTLEAQGSFAQSQAQFLKPNPEASHQLDRLLRENQVGVVAHFYMDAELQGLLSSTDWPNIHISDSLVMADRALEMAKLGMKAIIVLGVDFMSENVRAVLDVSGYSHVPVYRLSENTIGCSLAEAADTQHYGAYLDEAKSSPNPLHVIYINTSLQVKAKANHVVPTITCTSSNVVPLILQAAGQIENISIWFGPDTYMGQNLQTYFSSIRNWSDEEIHQIHPAHSRQTIEKLLQNFHFFEQGTCIVHHMFGEEVTRIIQESYQDAFVTAHLEVPGEMFELGLKAQLQNRGVVGSTSQILNFITKKLESAMLETQKEQVLRFILGTESGMVTAIVKKVQEALRSSKANQVKVEIIFPVAQEAIAQTENAELPIVPGVQSGEGCTTAGACATCPYMKMNSFTALIEILEKIGSEAELGKFEPNRFENTIGEKTITELGTESIMAMRKYQKDGKLPQNLIEKILSSHP